MEFTVATEAVRDAILAACAGGRDARPPTGSGLPAIAARGITLERYAQVPEEFLEFLGAWLLLLCFVRELQEARSSGRDRGGAGGSASTPPSHASTG